MGKKLGITGGALSAAYLIGLTWLLSGRWDAFRALPLNELGDFLAGAFGPLAILWLVLGFFQQGIELRQNSAALHLQAEELANSVQQQKELVEVARQQYEADRASVEHQLRVFELEREEQKQKAAPKFLIQIGGQHGGFHSIHTFIISNYGASCSEVRMSSEDQDITFLPAETPILREGDKMTINFRLPIIPHFESASIKISFVDNLARPGVFNYRLTFLKEDHYSTAVLTPIP